jgi:L-aspartate oxidase
MLSVRSIGAVASKRLFCSKSAAAAFSSLSSHDRLLVVGSGVAGSAAALVAAQVYNIPVTILHAGSTAHDCNSYWAQGGIIYRNYSPQSGDSSASLAKDIHAAGAGLCLDKTVLKVATEGPSVVQQLLLDSSGTFAHVPFDKCPETGDLSLCLGACVLTW